MCLCLCNCNDIQTFIRNERSGIKQTHYNVFIINYKLQIHYLGIILCLMNVVFYNHQVFFLTFHPRDGSVLVCKRGFTLL